MRVTGRHRSLELAERKRRALEKKYQVPVSITSRRNDRGHYSRRGRVFTFEFEPGEKEKGRTIEWTVTWKYRYTYHGQDRVRTLGFWIWARLKSRAVQLSFIAVKRGYDDATPSNNIAWAQEIAWDEQEAKRILNTSKHNKEYIEVR